MSQEPTLPEPSLSGLPHTSATCAWQWTPPPYESDHMYPCPDRQSYLGGHDAAAILGWSSWTTRQDVYAAKVHGARPETNERMHMGLVLEQVILQEFARRCGGRMLPGYWGEHETIPFIAGTPDAFLLLGDDPDEVATIEKPNGKRILDSKLVAAAPSDWINGGVPIECRVQMQHYMTIFGLQLATLVVCFRGQQIVAFDVEYDPMLEAQMLDACQRFWREHIETKIPPSNDAPWKAPSATDLLPAETKTIVLAKGSDEWEALCQVLEARAASAQAEEMAEPAKDRIAELCPPGTAIVGADGKVLASYGIRVEQPKPAKRGTVSTVLNVRPSKLLAKYLVDNAPDGE